MRNQRPNILFLSIIFILFISCQKWTEQEIYQRPDWLPGKLYTTVSVQENLSLFTECLERTGLDTILDVSGVWSVFAPNNEAMQQYLTENHYASVSDIPLEKLERITKFHVVQNPWTLEQLQTLSANGWRKGNTSAWYSYAYKRETMLKNPVQKYWIKRENRKEMIVLDSTIADSYRRVYTESRKYAPIFYDEYFEENNLTSEDYSFYFDRPYEKGNVYFAGAKVLEADIFAENGFVHIIDRVVDPMLNAKELLEREIPGESYKLFLQMVDWYYPSFDPNMVATFNQPEVRMGGLIDTLWDLTYPDLSFDLQKELVGVKNPNFNQTLVSHNGFYAPTDEAFIQFIDGILTVKSGFPHWPDYKSLPKDIQNIIIGQQFMSTPIYPSTNQYKQVFRQNSRFRQNEEDIIRKEFGSNCTFIGINSYIPDKVFTSVTGPVFCRPHYTIFRLAMQYANIDDVVANHEGELYFFPIPDYALEHDSALVLNWIDKDRNIYNFRAYDRFMQQMVGISRNTLRNLILNHVGTPVSGGSTGREIIRTLRGNTITWDHTNNTIRGTRACTIGYHGETVVTCTTTPLDEPADNGKAWSVGYWFNF